MSDLFGKMQADPGLFSYLNQYQQPQRRAPMPSDGDNYGYASSMPMPYKNPRLRMLGGATEIGAGGAVAASTPLMVAASGGAGATMAPAQVAGGLLLGKHGYDAIRRARLQMQGIHPDQDIMDRDLNAMRYYGHDNLRGPR